MRCCKTKGNIIIPPIVIMPQAPPIQRQVIPSPCPAKEIPHYIPVNNCYGPRGPRRLYRPTSPGQYPLYPRGYPTSPPRQYPTRLPSLKRRPPPRYPRQPPPPGPDYDDEYGDY